MAGRGRGATLPAWMTAGGADAAIAGNGHMGSTAPSHNSAAGQFEDYNSSNSNQPPRYQDAYVPPAQTAPAPMSYSMGSVPPPQYNQRQDSRGRDDGRRDGARPNGRERSARSSSRSKQLGNSSSSGPGSSRIGSWKRGGSRVSNFDVRPPDGVELPPIGVIATGTGVPNSFFSYANNPAVSGAPLPGSGAAASKYGATPYQQPKVDPNAASMLTRHARRIYAGGIPPRATEIEIANFFNDVMTRALHPARTEGPPVIKIYLNVEKCYAFVEFGSIELTTAAMQLDGIKFEHYTGTTIVRVRRPNDYRPEMLPPNLGPIPTLNLTSFGIAPTIGGGASSAQTGPGKVFIGGLPYNLTDEQIMELMGAFGPIKSFHQVRDPGSITSKGYGFCEYVNPANAEAAIAGLNGMALGEKTLSVRLATQGASAATAGAAQQQQQFLGGLGGMAPGMGIYGAGAGAFVPPPQAAQMGGVPPTRVLRLSNMVTREDLYNEAEYVDIKEDVRLECLQYGKVLSVVMPRVKEGYSAAAECLIFVEFEAVEGAMAAAKVLNGRKFAENVVHVAYFSEKDFATQHLI
uniref:RRM domain-containing protein n=1 Tax=Spumella elongata TaxID=89044 RepID=A0A7S3GNQ6_9STRA|mmetsp:Transcript_11252/g.19883  ORF Transcript_11252/g.19883 Transcript_11252/m.19883 type:complete len:575 (+) Transcript_11252:60-1784(+)